MLVRAPLGKANDLLAYESVQRAEGREGRQGDGIEVEVDPSFARQDERAKDIRSRRSARHALVQSSHAGRRFSCAVGQTSQLDPTNVEPRQAAKRRQVGRIAEVVVGVEDDA